MTFQRIKGKGRKGKGERKGRKGKGERGEKGKRREVKESFGKMIISFSPTYSRIKVQNMKTLVFNYLLNDPCARLKDCTQGTYWFKVPDSSKKTVGEYFKKNMDHVLSFEFFNPVEINCYWIEFFEDIVDSLPETLVVQLETIINARSDDYETYKSFLDEENKTGLSQKVMRDLLSALTPEELYDVLVNEYDIDTDISGTITYTGTIEEEEEDEEEEEEEEIEDDEESEEEADDEELEEADDEEDQEKELEEDSD